MSALVPDLLAASNAASNLVRRHQYAAGGHLMDSASDVVAEVAVVHRELAVQYALEAYAARLERDHLFAAYRAGEQHA